MTVIYVVCGALTVAMAANLVLTARLAHLVQRAPAGPPAAPQRLERSALSVGQEVAPFTTTSVEGRPVSLAAMAECVVGFFLVGCPPCQAAVDEYAALAGRLADTGVPALAVIRYAASDLERPAGRHELAAETERLARAAVVVHEQDGGSVAAAFGVTAYPLFYRVRRADGRHVVVAEAPTVRHFYRLEAP